MQTEFLATRRPDVTYTAYDLKRNDKKFGALVRNRLGSWTYHDDFDVKREERVRQAMLVRGTDATLKDHLRAVRAVVLDTPMARAVAACEDLGRRHAAQLRAKAELSSVERALTDMARRVGVLHFPQSTAHH